MSLWQKKWYWLVVILVCRVSSLVFTNTPENKCPTSRLVFFPKCCFFVLFLWNYTLSEKNKNTSRWSEKFSVHSGQSKTHQQLSSDAERLWVVAPPWPDHFFPNGWRSHLPSLWQDQIKRCTQDGWAASQWEIGGQDRVSPCFLLSFCLVLSDKWCVREILFVLFSLLIFVLSSSVLLSLFRWQWWEIKPRNWLQKCCYFWNRSLNGSDPSLTAISPGDQWVHWSSEENRHWFKCGLEGEVDNKKNDIKCY